MAKTIEELIADGITIEEIAKMAAEEKEKADAAAAEKKKAEEKTKTIAESRSYLIADILDYTEALLGEELSEEDAEYLSNELNTQLEKGEAIIVGLMEANSYVNEKKKTSDTDTLRKLIRLGLF